MIFSVVTFDVDAVRRGGENVSFWSGCGDGSGAFGVGVFGYADGLASVVVMRVEDARISL